MLYYVKFILLSIRKIYIRIIYVKTLVKEFFYPLIFFVLFLSNISNIKFNDFADI